MSSAGFVLYPVAKEKLESESICGSCSLLWPTGFIPVFTVYITEHCGLLIVPADVLIMITVSGLVGIEAALTPFVVLVVERC